MSFLPLQVVPGSQINDGPPDSIGLAVEQWMMSFQAVGILGLSEPNVQQFFPEWETRPVSSDQRHRFLRSYDISVLAQDAHMPCEDDDDFDLSAVDKAAAEAREQFLAMDNLVWIKVADFEAAVAQQEWLRSLTLTRSSPCMRPSSGVNTPRSFEDMIKGIVMQHQQALLTPPSATDPSPKVGYDAKEASAAPEPVPEPMDVDPPRKDELAPASSGIV